MKSEYELLSFFAISSGAIAVFCILLFLIRFQRQKGKFFALNVDPQCRAPDLLQHYLLPKYCWYLIHAVGIQILPCMTWSQRDRINKALRCAGMPAWGCADFFALQLVIAICSMLLLALLVFVFSTEQLFSSSSFGLIVVTGLVSAGCPQFWIRSRSKRRLIDIGRGLPFFLDMVALGLDSGMNLQSSVQLAIDHLESGPLRQEWTQTLFDMRSGLSRAEALRQMSQRVELQSVRQLVAALIQGESMGLSLSGTVGEYARQQRQARLLQAEKLALQAPIKMLFPLAFCIFPCTFLVLGFPVVAQLMGLES